MLQLLVGIGAILLTFAVAGAVANWIAYGLFPPSTEEENGVRRRRALMRTLLTILIGVPLVLGVAVAIDLIFHPSTTR